VSLALSKLILVGKTTNNSVTISGSTLEVYLNGVDISSRTPIAVSNSDATFILTTANSLKSSSLMRVLNVKTVGDHLRIRQQGLPHFLWGLFHRRNRHWRLRDLRFDHNCGRSVTASGGTGIDAGNGSPTLKLLGDGNSKLNAI
jgi:hypothetical protein